MKILLANKFFFINGGSETVFFQERDFLISSGVQVFDFSMNNERNSHSAYSDYFVGSREYHKNNSVFQKVSAAALLIHSSEAVKNISALIKEKKPDIVHCHNIYHQLTPSVISAAHKLGVPVVLTLHDYKPVCPTYLRLQNGNVCSSCLKGDFFNVVKHRCAEGSLGKSALLYAEAVIQRMLGNYEKVSKVIAPSKFMGDSIINRFSTDKIEVIYNGIDLNTISPSDEDENYALYLGRLSKEKGINTLLEAYRQNDVGIPLKICGTGPIMEQLVLNKPDNVEFLGYQSGAALEEIIRKSSVVIVPSEWYENCPMSILEAMAYGKPVIGAKIGGIPELVIDNENGLLYESGNVVELAKCISKLSESRRLRIQMGRVARKRVAEKFSLQNHNSRLMKVYQELI